MNCTMTKDARYSRYLYVLYWSTVQYSAVPGRTVLTTACRVGRARRAAQHNTMMRQLRACDALQRYTRRCLAAAAASNPFSALEHKMWQKGAEAYEASFAAEMARPPNAAA